MQYRKLPYKIISGITSTPGHTYLYTTLLSIIGTFNWLVYGIVSFLTLQKGDTQGYKLLGVLSIPAIVLAFVGKYEYFVAGILLTLLPVVLISNVLRRYNSWTLVMELVTLIGLFICASAYLFFPGFIQTFISSIITNFIESISNLGVNSSDDFIIKFTNFFTRYGFGILITIKLFALLTILAIGRAIQAMFDNPGGFSREFATFSLNWKFSAAVGLSLIGILFDMTLAHAFLPIVLLPFVLLGLSIVHVLARSRKHSRILLLVFYAFLILYAPLMLLLLVLVGFFEKYYKFRTIS